MKRAWQKISRPCHKWSGHAL